MNFYSYQGQEPQGLPERLRLEDGTTITSLHHLTNEELNSYGFVGPIVKPEFNTETQKLVWNGSEYDAVDLTTEDINLIQSESLESIRRGFDVSNFWSQLHQTSFYHRIRKEAGTHLQINVLYSEFVTLSKTLSDIEQYLKKLFLVIDFTEQQVESLSNILDFYHLNFVCDKETNTYDFDTDSIIDNTTRPFTSWVWNGIKWVAPVDYPTDGKSYIWNEKTKKWKKI